jgi:hypothetical protein
MTDLWERQPKERTKAFELFCLYRNMGTARTLDKVHAKQTETSLKPITLRQIKHYSSVNSWVERSEAYDDHLEEIARLEHEEALKDMVRRHAENSVTLQEKVMGLLEHPEMVADNNEDRMPASKLAWILNTTTNSYEKAALLERLSRGEPTEHIEEKHTGLDELGKAIQHSREEIKEKKVKRN